LGLLYLGFDAHGLHADAVLLGQGADVVNRCHASILLDEFVNS
jgi:hypothetical protein